MAHLDPQIVEETLRRFISAEVDYDIHKEFEEEDSYPVLARAFIQAFDLAATQAEESI